MIEADISKSYYDNKDLQSLSPKEADFLYRHNPYMSDGTESLTMQLIIEFCHKAWLEGALNFYKHIKETADEKTDSERH